MKASMQRSRRRQFDLFSQALQWARSNNMYQCKRCLKHAIEYSPITEMQWWHLKMIIGNDELQKIRVELGAQREVESVRG